MKQNNQTQTQQHIFFINESYKPKSTITHKRSMRIRSINADTKKLSTHFY